MLKDFSVVYQLWARGQTVRPRVQAVSGVLCEVRYRGPGSRDQLRHPGPGSLIRHHLALIIDRSGWGAVTALLLYILPGTDYFWH